MSSHECWRYCVVCFKTFLNWSSKVPTRRYLRTSNYLPKSSLAVKWGKINSDIHSSFCAPACWDESFNFRNIEFEVCSDIKVRMRLQKEFHSIVCASFASHFCLKMCSHHVFLMSDSSVFKNHVGLTTHNSALVY